MGIRIPDLPGYLSVSKSDSVGTNTLVLLGSALVTALLWRRQSR